MKRFRLSVNQFKKPLQFLFIASAAFWLDACKVKEDAVTPQEPPVDASPANKFSSDIASNWAVVQQKLTKTTAGYSPPVAARAYAYGGLVMYEAAVGGLNNNQSLAGQLTDLTTLPKTETGKDYNWAISVNAAEATILRALYAEASRPTAVVNKIVIGSRYRGDGSY